MTERTDTSPCETPLERAFRRAVAVQLMAVNVGLFAWAQRLAESEHWSGLTIAIWLWPIGLPFGMLLGYLLLSFQAGATEGRQR